MTSPQRPRLLPTNASPTERFGDVDTAISALVHLARALVIGGDQHCEFHRILIHTGQCARRHGLGIDELAAALDLAIDSDADRLTRVRLRHLLESWDVRQLLVHGWTQDPITDGDTPPALPGPVALSAALYDVIARCSADGRDPRLLWCTVVANPGLPDTDDLQRSHAVSVVASRTRSAFGGTPIARLADAVAVLAANDGTTARRAQELDEELRRCLTDAAPTVTMSTVPTAFADVPQYVRQLTAANVP
jgi:hypothetical protein